MLMASALNMLSACPSQGAGGEANSTGPAWTGDRACSNNTSYWPGINCTDGRVTSLDLSNLGARGPLELLSPLTALNSLVLVNNSFAGVHLWAHDVRSSTRPVCLG